MQECHDWKLRLLPSEAPATFLIRSLIDENWCNPKFKTFFLNFAVISGPRSCHGDRHDCTALQSVSDKSKNCASCCMHYRLNPQPAL